MKPLSKPQPRSVLSIDIGHKRVGLAGCDPLGITITILPAIIRKGFIDDLKKFQFHCQKRSVEGLIIGIPLDDNGLFTKQAKHCIKYGERIANSLNLPLAWVNEHSTSWTAAEKNNLHNDRTGQLDSESAALILEQWLNEGPELKPIQTATYQPTQLNCNAGS